MIDAANNKVHTIIIKLWRKPKRRPLYRSNIMSKQERHALFFFSYVAQRAIHEQSFALSDRHLSHRKRERIAPFFAVWVWWRHRFCAAYCPIMKLWVNPSVGLCLCYNLGFTERMFFVLHNYYLVWICMSHVVYGSAFLFTSGECRLHVQRCVLFKILCFDFAL